MLREVQRHGDYYHAEEEEEEGICLCSSLAYVVFGEEGGCEGSMRSRRNRRKRWDGRKMGEHVLNMNFSVGVNMYNENVT